MSGYSGVVDGFVHAGIEHFDCDPNCHPLVVIDPEDAEQVERLAKVYLTGMIHAADLPTNLSNALREFATPTPPKPDEPLGLGAVVEDAKGERYIRCQLGNVAPWRAESPPSEQRPWRYYADLDIPHDGVLTNGLGGDAAS